MVAGAVDAWRAAATVPTVDSCQLAGQDQLLLKTSQRDLELGTVRKVVHTLARGGDGQWHPSGFPQELPQDTVLTSVSPSGALQARVVRVTSAALAGGREGLFPAPTDAAPPAGTYSRVDISDRCGLVASISLPSVAYADGWFEGLSWSPDEGSLVVVAEEPRPPQPTNGYFAPAGTTAGEAATSTTTDDGSLYDFKPDWGEAKVGMRRSVLILVDLVSSTAAVLARSSTHISAGSPVFVSDRSIVFCGTFQSAQDSVGYGITGCTQRGTSLFAVDPTNPSMTHAVQLLDDAAIPTARLPSVTLDGMAILFIATLEQPSELYTHGQCSVLCRLRSSDVSTALRDAAAAAPDLTIAPAMLDVDTVVPFPSSVIDLERVSTSIETPETYHTSDNYFVY